MSSRNAEIVAVAGVHRGAPQRLTHRRRAPERRDQLAVPVGYLETDDVRAVLTTDHITLVGQGADKVIGRRDGQLAPSRDLFHGQSARGPTDRLEHTQGA
jgi:hypothetical protein